MSPAADHPDIYMLEVQCSRAQAIQIFLKSIESKSLTDLKSLE